MGSGDILRGEQAGGGEDGVGGVPLPEAPGGGDLLLAGHHPGGQLELFPGGEDGYIGGTNGQARRGLHPFAAPGAGVGVIANQLAARGSVGIEEGSPGGPDNSDLSFGVPALPLKIVFTTGSTDQPCGYVGLSVQRILLLHQLVGDSGEVDELELFAPCKTIASDTLQALGDVHLLQRRAVGEGPFTHREQPFVKDHLSDIAAVEESVGLYGGDSLGDHHVLDIAAGHIRIADSTAGVYRTGNRNDPGSCEGDGFHGAGAPQPVSGIQFAGDGQIFQTSEPFEGFLANGGHTVGNRHIGDAFAVEECSLTNGGDTVRNG